ncbi:Endonuclease IV [Fibrobacter sp. UWH9]|uniref:deoxyribonuclease IV n=1 Tax=unclassified Fibrobacter TaxID=2634177 RepID=UPI0009184F1B|nr:MULTISPECIES: deoxyribonuclease IV [Fibrobacter]MDO4946820.1 deoxyribonuclease IV [Fibrobacter sp.]MCL4102352.1 putative endonuclease 4 [Fibrobacter succinogenes]OWV16981.1 endonuclease IV [Fibrobacter sp. UWH1]SHH39292.1 Endonuclease IV [Fibrobacter sp. UWH9]SHL23540.1 Endonuclease IV [Fibrobacter sp. UWH5]
MLHIGCHLSSSSGFLAMGQTALSIGADTFQFFTRNPRGGAAKPFDKADALKLVELLEANQFAPILAHAPYTLNACAADEGLRQYAEDVMADDIFRMDHFPGAMYNFHPGSHVKQGAEVGIEFISAMLNRLLKPSQKTTVLLETMAGKGSEVGRTFEELKAILDRVELSSKMGVCMDTCHVFDGGYDIVDHLDDVLELFDRVIGLDKLKAIHLNDSKNPMGSHKDRHEVIGGGFIGLEALTRVVNHPSLKNLPFYLETPNELPGYAAEIALMRSRFQE